MANYEININDIEWITNGERASSLNMNRPLKQYITKNNMLMNQLGNKVDLLGTGPSLENIDSTNNLVKENNLGDYLLRGSDVVIPAGLPVGWNCWIISDGADITVSFETTEVDNSGEASFVLTSDKTVKIVKISELRWLVNTI